MNVIPLPQDRTYPTTATEPERTFFADGSRVVLRNHDEPRKRRKGTTYGILAGPKNALQAVIWDDGDVSNVGIQVLERLAEPVPATARETARTAKRVAMFAARFLAETPEGRGHPGPEDDVLKYRFAGCAKRPPHSLYPRIRVEILRILMERACEPTPGAPTIMVKYVPWSGPWVTVPLAVGNRLMKNAKSDNCGAIGWVTTIEDTTHHGEFRTWVTLKNSSGQMTYWTANEIPRWFIKVD